MTPEPPREFVAFVDRHLHRLRHDAQVLAGDEYAAHGLYSQALIDVAIRWPWFALLRRLNRPGAAEVFLQETLLRRSARHQAEEAGLVDVEVWFTDDPLPPAGVAALEPAPRNRSPRTLPLESFGVEVGPVIEAAVAWWHAYVAHRYARVGATAAAVMLVLLTVIPYLQRH